jgi:endonuclease/exonuclease/phosphatase family metal-dependent hydrolase
MGDVFEAVNPRDFECCSRSYPGFLPVLHLDHFYCDRQLSRKSFRIHRSRKALLASDHFPMIAEFETKSCVQI